LELLWTAESLPPAEDRPAMTKPRCQYEEVVRLRPFGEYSAFNFAAASVLSAMVLEKSARV
jgi:hypothetical protein